MNRLRNAHLALFICLPYCGHAAAADKDVLDGIDARFDEHQRIALQIWDYAELGYLEQKSSQLLQDTLRAEGFEIEPGVAGIPTAFIAAAGSGKPVIALLAEFDALPGIFGVYRAQLEGVRIGQGVEE